MKKLLFLIMLSSDLKEKTGLGLAGLLPKWFLRYLSRSVLLPFCQARVKLDS